MIILQPTKFSRIFETYSHSLQQVNYQLSSQFQNFRVLYVNQPIGSALTSMQQCIYTTGTKRLPSCQGGISEDYLKILELVKEKTQCVTYIKADVIATKVSFGCKKGLCIWIFFWGDTVSYSYVAE